MSSPASASRSGTAHRPHVVRQLHHRDRAGVLAPAQRRCSTPPACRPGASSSRPRRSGASTASGSQGVTAEEPILIPDGERFKHLATVGRIYDALIRAGADRASAIVAIGGGVTGDIAGFAAATYLRGIPVVQVPTTLLAQVDSAVGGKVGVNHRAGQEPHRRVPSARDGGDRSRAARDASAARVPRRTVRGREVRRDRQPSAVRPDVAESRRALRARRLGAAAGRGRVVPHQGGHRRAGRTGIRPAPHAQLRPHRGTRARSGHEVSPLPARRGGRVRHARRGRPRRRARRFPRGRSRGAGGAASRRWDRCPPWRTCRPPRWRRRPSATRR